ncbi:MAG: glutamine--fructose-6-phosphate transaminase (isomerizing) [Gammaproteobacteria bacterium]|nr:glutamine--fructose-6-phosphate transaminase (isomerizing) [Gammaproteobacteria bacterium]
MCGIIAAASNRDVTPVLITGLHQMEYRGYDSAGVCLYNSDGLVPRRVKGRVKKLEEKIKEHPCTGNIGVAHTRWATHGVPTEHNAHPIISHGEFAIVHNGIIENHHELKTDLIHKGYVFNSETDTEVVSHLLYENFKKYKIDNNVLKALQETVALLKGSYALAVLAKEQPDKIYAVRYGCPLIVGLSESENLVASDQLALLPVTNNFIFLDEGEIAVLSSDNVDIYDIDGIKITKEVTKSTASLQATDLGSYQHFMQKEIAEQPLVLSDTLMGNITATEILDTTFGSEARKTLDQTQAIQFVACGSSYHAALVAKYWIEKWVGIPCIISVASEYRMQKPVVLPNTLLVAISQSGETADTLAAVKVAKDYDYLAVLAICNVPHSTLTRQANLVMHTRAGAEIGVASTKGFLTQLLGLLMLTVCLTKRDNVNNNINIKIDEQAITDHVHLLPRLITQSLELESQIKDIAKCFETKHHTLFLGRGPSYPIAMEGALKLKEISYIHAECYLGGELKHGPLALIDEDMPVVALVCNDEHQEKMLANLQEVQARGGEIFVFAEEGTKLNYSSLSKHICYLPSCHELLKPLVYTIPMQLLAYHIAILRGTDIDKPRNLAKSVTVE